jgi:penicillin-binding protein 1A
MQKYYKDHDKSLQIVSPQNAFIITNILRDTVHSPDGFLYYAKQRIIESGKEFPPVEIAGKTGTTQNFSDAWEVGFTPEITVASWVGFNKYGLSLGNGQAGVVVLGNTFLEYMRQYHLGKGKLVFKNPGGVYSVQVCKESGLLPSKFCKAESLYYEYFLPGTVPKETCNVCEAAANIEEKSLNDMSDIYDKKFNSSNFKLLDDSNINVDKSIIDKYGSTDNQDIGNNLNNIDLYKDKMPDIINEKPKIKDNTEDINKKNENTKTDTTKD